MMTIELDKNDLKKIGQIEQQLAGAKASMRRKILRDTAKEVIKHTRKRTRKQIDLEGKPFGQYSDNVQHKRPRKKSRKMLVRMTRHLRTLSITEDTARVGFVSPVKPANAAKHQYGFIQKFNKSQFKNKEPANRDDPATRKQAKALIAEGFKRRIKGKGYKKPSIKWIVSNMTIGQAGLILRLMRGSKEFWQTVLPARPFLGATKEEQREMIKLAIEKASNEVNRALQT